MKCIGMCLFCMEYDQLIKIFFEMVKFEGCVVIKKKKYSLEKFEFFRDYLLVYKKNLLFKNFVW